MGTTNATLLPLYLYILNDMKPFPIIDSHNKAINIIYLYKMLGFHGT